MGGNVFIIHKVKIIMTHIYIKSFNRPYYLDRCLSSIEKFVKGNYKIIVLDDGTPEKYLNKIVEKHPQITIQKSDQYQEKVRAIQENLESGKEINGFQIPISLWKNAVKLGSEYFIMTEDDVWFTEEINVDTLAKEMSFHRLVLIKLGWISERPIRSKLQPISESVLGIDLSVFTAPKWFMKYFFFQNKWKVYSLLYRLGWVDNFTKLEYWSMNALLMGMFQKDYWLAVWETLENKVDEQEQLINAIEWYRSNKKKYLFAKLDYKMMNTTYITSATNSYHKYGEDFDVNQFNAIMNEEWYRGNLNSLDNFPKDIRESTYYTILEQKQNLKALPENWKKWAEKFKDQYRRQMVDVD